MADLKRLSKFMALILRHQASEFDLTLDGEGFADFNAVWQQIQQRYPGLYTLQDVLLMLESDAGKQRYELREGRIRAMVGHSVVSEIVYTLAVPPEILYHGTTTAALPLIQAGGLSGQKRQYVHLAVEQALAQNVAGRHSKSTVLLRIQALRAHHAGIVFYHPEPKHYLAKAIPPEFIEFPA
jgi:putative RNA 2'-phosphotransferase